MKISCKNSFLIRLLAVFLMIAVLNLPGCVQPPAETESDTAAVTETEIQTEQETEEAPKEIAIRPLGEVVYPYIDSVRAYLEAGQDAAVSDYTDGSDDQHKDIVVEWDYTGEEDVLSYIFEYSLNGDFSDAVSAKLTASTTKRRLTNLLKSTEYHVRVTAVRESSGVSDTASFTTTSLGPRILNVGGYDGNVRDLGGYVTQDGHTVLQNKVFRGSALDNCVDANHSTLHSVGKKFLNEEVGVKTEIDLRGTSENCGRTTPALTSAENYLQAAVINFHGAFYSEQASLYLKVFRVFADEDNYPIYFHCAAGADRTGTVAAILLALLGVSRGEIEQDFEITSFSKVGLRQKAKLSPVFTNLQRYNGDTLSEKAENYLLSIGMTRQEIYNIKAIMLGLDPGAQTEETTYELKVREFLYSASKGGDIKLTLLEEAEAEKITLGGTEVPFSQNGKDIFIKENDIGSVGSGSFTGTVTFKDGGKLDFRLIADEADITDGLAVTHLSAGPSAGYYTYVFMSYPCGIFDGIEYHFHSRPDEFPDVESNIFINGVSVKELNGQDMSKYKFAEYPGNSIERHKVPVDILCRDNTVTLLLHTGWLSEYLNGREMEITVTKDLEFENKGVRFFLSKDKTFVNSKTGFHETETDPS